MECAHPLDGIVIDKRNEMVSCNICGVIMHPLSLIERWLDSGLIAVYRPVPYRPCVHCTMERWECLQGRSMTGKRCCDRCRHDVPET
jgi:hypothetical protein